MPAAHAPLEPVRPGRSRPLSIARLAWGLRIGIWVMALASIGLGLARWCLIETSEFWLPEQVRLAGIHAPRHMDLIWRAAGLLLEALPLAALLYTLLGLSRMSAGFARGDLFTATTVQGLRAVGRGMLWLIAMEALYQLGSTALLSWLARREQGGHGGVVQFGFSTFECGLVLIGLTMLLLGMVMDRARELDEDAAQII